MSQAIKFGIALIAGEAVAFFGRGLVYLFTSILLRDGGGLARHLASPSKGRGSRV